MVPLFPFLFPLFFSILIIFIFDISAFQFTWLQLYGYQNVNKNFFKCFHSNFQQKLINVNVAFSLLCGTALHWSMHIHEQPAHSYTWRAPHESEKRRHRDREIAMKIRDAIHINVYLIVLITLSGGKKTTFDLCSFLAWAFSFWSWHFDWNALISIGCFRMVDSMIEKRRSEFLLSN